MFNNLNLSKKFNIFLIVIFISGLVISGTALSAILNQKAEHEVTSRANLLMATMISVRKYTQTQVNPQLAPKIETEEQFIPQTVPAYSAREVFEDFRTNSEYQNFFYKEATLNPTNLRDKADNFETELVEKLRKNPNLQELTGYRPLSSGQVFYIARPIAIKDQNCLRCHSSPEAAPKSQIATYGDQNGFGWKLNEIVSAQVVSVPAKDVLDEAKRSFLLIMGIVAAAFAIAILITNIFLKQTVIRPIKRMVSVANEISTGNMDADFSHKYQDEIGMLATAFNRMKISIAMAMNMLKQNRGS